METETNSFKCCLCTEIAYKPIACEQCGSFVCTPCEAKISQRCPMCRSTNKMAPDPELKKIISAISIMCKRDCGAEMKIGYLMDNSHSPLCPNMKFKCN